MSGGLDPETMLLTSRLNKRIRPMLFQAPKQYKILFTAPKSFKNLRPVLHLPHKHYLIKYIKYSKWIYKQEHKIFTNSFHFISPIFFWSSHRWEGHEIYYHTLTSPFNHMGLDVQAGGPWWESNPVLVKKEINYNRVRTTCSSTYNVPEWNKPRECTATVPFLLYTPESKG